MNLGTNNETTKDGKVYNKWYFNTLTFAQFAELGNAFYPLNSDNRRLKVVPPQIGDWMTDKSLARNPSGFLHLGLRPRRLLVYG